MHIFHVEEHCGLGFIHLDPSQRVPTAARRLVRDSTSCRLYHIERFVPGNTFGRGNLLFRPDQCKRGNNASCNLLRSMPNIFFSLDDSGLQKNGGAMIQNTWLKMLIARFLCVADIITAIHGYGLVRTAEIIATAGGFDCFVAFPRCLFRRSLVQLVSLLEVLDSRRGNGTTTDVTEPYLECGVTDPPLWWQCQSLELLMQLCGRFPLSVFS
mmetsp:Transcript_97615/g.248029  ORF Transcript_97615/g.248029 Transcript_97615/m.248029 type:complete len:212 (-) Transcript_97615:503-1138(-)